MLITRPAEQPTKSEAQKQSDLLLYTLIILHIEHGIEKVSRERLHSAWESYLWLLKRKHFEYDGFYKDIVSGCYPSLDDAIRNLLGFCIYYKIPEQGDYFYIEINRRDGNHFESLAEKEEWNAIRNCVPYLSKRIRTLRKKWWYK